MTTVIALQTREIPVVDQRPYLHFSHTNSQIFKLLLPDAEPITGAIRTTSPGETFKLPTVIPPGRSLATIEPRCLPGFIRFYPYHEYILLEADEAQAEQVSAICQTERYYGDGIYFSSDARWWHFPLSNGTPATPLDTSHVLYAIAPPSGWTPPRYPISDDNRYWIAVGGNYGTEVKRDNGRPVSALKVSATAFSNLRALFADQMHDLTTPRSAYRYFTFTNNHVLAHKDSSSFYFQISGSELKTFATYTARNYEDRCYVWIDRAWIAMPSAAGKYAGSVGGPLPYRPASRHNAPKWTPPGERPALGSDASTSTFRGNNLTVSYSQRDPNEPGWWWMRGDNEHATKSIRMELRRFGCEWSKRRQQWYYPGAVLPAGLQLLLGIDTTVTPPAPDTNASPAATPAGPAAAPEPVPATTAATATVEHTAYAVGQIVASRHPVMRPGDPPTRIPVNAKGIVQKATARGVGSSAEYRITFPDYTGDEQHLLPESAIASIAFQPGQQGWAGRELLIDPEGVIEQATRATVVDYLGGSDETWDTYYSVRFASDDAIYKVPGRFLTFTEPARGIMIRSGDSFGNRHKITILAPAATLDADEQATIEAPPPDAIASELAALAGMTHAAPQPLPPPASAQAPPSMTIRTADEIFSTSEKRVVLENAITAARNAAPISLAAAPASTNAIAIPQEYVGELTGSIAGDVHCYGYAVDHGTCIWLNMAGPRTAVEAIRAKLGLGDIVNLSRWDAPAVELTAGEGVKGKYTDIPSNMSDRKFYNVILIHELMAAPIYAERSTTYVIALDEAAASRKVYDQLKALLGIPVFTSWRDYLWHAGRSAGMIRSCECGGGLQTYALSLDRADWSGLIAGALQGQVIQLPA